MSLLRVCARAAGLPAASRSNTTAPLLISRRLYASKSKGSSKASKEKEFEKTGNKRAPVSTNSFIPGSKLRITDAAQEEYGKCESKMKSAVEWYRKEVGGLETRAAGRVTPALLSPVRVVLPDRGSDSIRLEEIATVGVKDGSTLIVTVFEESSLKHVETALYDAKIPGITPQRADARTIRIPIPKPTVEMRTSLQTTAQREAENTRVQLRKLHQASIKRGKYDKHSSELEEFQKLTDVNIGEVDKILANMKKATK